MGGWVGPTSVMDAWKKRKFIIQIINKRHFKVYDVNSHQHVSAAVAAIFMVMLLLQEYKGTDVISCTFLFL
jgi:hypothetical protein